MKRSRTKNTKKKKAKKITRKVRSTKRIPRIRTDKEIYQSRNSSYKRNYGITVEIYEEMLKAQENRCFICRRPPAKVRLCVDHRHVKGYKALPPDLKRLEVRGLLCNYCNRTIGMFEHLNLDPRLRLENTYKYFAKFKLKGDI